MLAFMSEVPLYALARRSVKSSRKVGGAKIPQPGNPNLEPYTANQTSFIHVLTSLYSTLRVPLNHQGYLAHKKHPPPRTLP